MALVSGVAGHWPKDGSVPEYVAAWIDWLLTPKLEREPGNQTQADWCRNNDIAENTVKTWRQKGVVKRAIAKRADELNLSTERIQRVINAMFKAAEQGDVKAATLVLQYADKLRPQRIIIEDRTLATLTDDELREQLAAAGILAESNADD